MRLIDADNIRDCAKYIKINEYFEPYIMVDDLVKLLDEQPTSYSVDKVVEEIEKANQGCCIYCGCDLYSDDVIEIVKQGGVSDVVCEWRKVDRPHNLPIYNTSCGKIRLQYATGIDIYCNGCGKKIKVVE